MASAVEESDPKSAQKRREMLLKRWAALRTERESWISHWKQISSVLLPRNGRYFVQDRNRGERRHNEIHDNTGTRALRTMAAGMMAGATSPARPWFRLAASDPDLNSYHPVRVWLDDVAQRMMRVFQKSNTYRALHQVYEELGAFGTGVSVLTESFDTVIHHNTVTVGEYALAQDYDGKVSVLFREFDKTVSELVRRFGYQKCSQDVQQLYRKGELEKPITIYHCIEPRGDRDPSKADALNMPFSSTYFESGRGVEGFLSEGGFGKFPVLAPRWNVTSGDVYGSSPGMESLGDIRQLQHEQIRKSQGINFKTDPPKQAPTALANRDHNMFPGATIFADAATPASQVRPIHEAQYLDLDHLLQDIQDVRERIRSSFYADLFLMLATAGPDTRMTATEVAERHEEKLLMLGPVLERLHNELLDPLIDRTFDRMQEAGMLPPPPPEIEGADLAVEFVSMLAQAQKAVGVVSVERFLTSLVVVKEKLTPEVVDKFDADHWFDHTVNILGIDPKLGRPDDDVAKRRDARAQAQAQADAAQVAEIQSKGIKNLAASPTSGASNALTDLADATQPFQPGYGPPVSEAE